MRSNVVDKYIIDILGSDKNPMSYQKKLEVVKKMLFLRMDNRVLNSMRQVMNEQIEDERGLMKFSDFKKMFYTAFRHSSDYNKKTVIEMLLPLIETSWSGTESQNVDDSPNCKYVSIGKLSQFIDFYNFAPVLVSSIRHKNDTSGDLSLFMGKNVHACSMTEKHIDEKLKDPKFASI